MITTITPKTAIKSLLAILALVALSACTAEVVPDVGTPAHTTVRTMSIAIGNKPAYTGTTRTNPTTGQWQVGDKVVVDLKFHTITPDGTIDGTGSMAQTLTCTTAATTADPTTGVVESPALWSATPAIIIVPVGSTQVHATYTYLSAPDARTSTVEHIIGILPDGTASTDDQTPEVVGGIATLPTTGTLTLPSPQWTRLTVMAVVNHIAPGRTVAIGNHSWTNPATATNEATATFHLSPPAFTLTVDGKPTAYTNVPYEENTRYILDARTTPATGDDEGAQMMWIDGTTDTDIAAKFNNDQGITHFTITGTGVSEKVGSALKAVTPGKKIHLLMPDETMVDARAFYGCASLASMSLPAVEYVGTFAFSGCTALTRLELTGTNRIDMNYRDTFSNPFDYMPTDKLTIVFHSEANLDNNDVKVEDKEVTFNANSSLSFTILVKSIEYLYE